MKNIKTKTIINSKDGSELILISAGEFTMGSPEGEGEPGEHPQHNVYLDAYYIGKYEVTNKQFAKFVNETSYQAQGSWKDYYKSGTEDHPVVSVTWNDATAYCQWANLRLPTEAEWEKAARGTDGRKYPWGNEWDASRCNNYSVDGLPSGPKPVGSFPSGASPYGCLDMVGNAWEWCSDWYLPNYYQNSPSINPKGPSRGLAISPARVRRGSSCSDDPNAFRAAIREAYNQRCGGANFRLVYKS